MASHYLLEGLAHASPLHYANACGVRNLWQMLSSPCDANAFIVSLNFLATLKETTPLQLSNLPDGIALFSTASDLVPGPACAMPGSCSLMEALLWSQRQLDTNPFKGTRDHRSLFATAYLDWALSLAKSSPALCAVCTGLAIMDCRLLGSQQVDRSTIRTMLEHFKVHFAWRNGTHPVIARESIQSLLKATTPKATKQAYRRLLSKTFRTHQGCGLLIQTPFDNPANAGVSLLNSFSPFGGLQLGTAQRFLEVLGLSEDEAQNTARRHCTPKDMIKASCCSLPEREQLELLKELCSCLTMEALRERHTREDIIDVFCAACMESVRLIIKPDPTPKEICFWICWLEKKLRGCLKRLVQPETSIYAERGMLSPQRKI